MTPLRKRMAQDLRLRGLSVSTQKHYLCFVGVYARYHGCSPERLGTEHVRDFLLHLEQLGLSNSTRNVYRCALGFLYTHTLGRPEVMDPVPRPRNSRPDQFTALTRAEVLALFDATYRPYDRSLLRLVYACGLRAAEARTLQTRDVDATTSLLYVRHGKGDKARAVPLHGPVLGMLREHWRRYRPPGPWLFPAARPGHPIGDGVPRWRDVPLAKSALEERFRRVRQRAGLRRRVTLHDLRRAHATHLLELGVDMRKIQVVLGHVHPNITARYLAVSTAMLCQIPCPLEHLDG